MMDTFREGFFWGVAVMIAVRILRRHWRKMKFIDKLLAMATIALVGLIAR